MLSRRLLLFYGMTLVESVNADLKKGLVTPQSLMSRLPYVTSNSYLRSYYTDPLYFPAYYHLGKHLDPKSCVALTLGSGLPISCFLLGSKVTEEVLAFQHKAESLHFPRLAKHNIRQVFDKKLDIHFGEFLDDGFLAKLTEHKWEVVLLDQELTYDDYLMYLRRVWPQVDSGGLVVLDMVNYNKTCGRAYQDFCNECNRDGIVIKSKYGIGIIEK